MRTNIEDNFREGIMKKINKNLKRYSTLGLSLTVVGYITVGLFISSMLFVLVFYRIFYSPNDFQSYWPFLEKVYWYIFQIVFYFLFK